MKYFGWVLSVIHFLGYPGIVALMFLESSFFPFPSEVVILPAGWLAAMGEMNRAMVIITGIIGSLFGAFFNYYFALFLGRPGILKIAEFKIRRWHVGRLLGISEKKLQKIENFFRIHGEITTFTCRLVPGIRQIISFPAGLARMNLVKFTAYTGLGAGIWVTILALIGYYVGGWVGGDEKGFRELAQKWASNMSWWLIAFVVAVTAGYIWYYYKIKKPRLELEKGNLQSFKES